MKKKIQFFRARAEARTMLRGAGKILSDESSRFSYVRSVTLVFMPPTALKCNEKTLRYRIRELRRLRRPLIGLLVTGRPAEPEPKRGRCSAGPAKFYQTDFRVFRTFGPRRWFSCLRPRLSRRKKPFATHPEIKIKRFFLQINWNKLVKKSGKLISSLFHFFSKIVRTFVRIFDLDKSIDRLRNLAQVIVRTLLCPEIK